MLKMTYTHAKANFALLWNEVTDNREIVIIDHRNKESIAVIAAEELESLIETAHLMRSPNNCQRLFSALERALKNEGEPSSVENLRKEIGFDQQTS
ncbi:MAG: type II toxin-antitoxin system Phd/YefM family antitoxin [Desulfamplus sp.]|nr:type II toxin-antitoxin system Phd/YefM family antitoxin [Desulfamplus sp.]